MEMETFMQVLNYVGAVWRVAGIYMLGLGRSYKWWLLYASSNLPFSVVAVCDKRWGFAVMGIVLCATGIWNYFTGKKKEKIAADKEVMSHLR